MTKHGISFTLGSLFTLFVAIIFLNLGLFASGTDLIEDGQHTTLNFVNIAHAQSDEQMVSETYPSPAKQLKDGVGMHDIQCNDSRELYIRQSQTPVCLYDETYDLMQGRGIELVPATPSSSTDIFTSEEAQWLADNPVIRVSFDPGWTPIEYADESGNLQGVTLDYIAEFEAISGADLVPVPAAETWADALMAVEERNAEIMYMVAPTPERLEYMSFTSPHYTIKTSMVSLNYTLLNIDDEGLTLITINGYEIESWLDENHPDTEYIPVDSPAEAYALLAAGGADAFTSVWPVAAHNAKMSGIDNVYNVGTTGHQYDLTVGYRNDLPLLGSIMQKTLDNIPQERIDSWYDAVAQTTDDAETLESVVIGVIDDAIALYDSDPANAFEQITSMELTNPQYPFAMDYLTTRIVAHGAFPERVGEIAVALTESNIPLDVILSDLEKGNVWAEYVFANPSTGIEQTKRSLYVLHDGYIFSSGYYTTS